jgi:hypothetical protein
MLRNIIKGLAIWYFEALIQLSRGNQAFITRRWPNLLTCRWSRFIAYGQVIKQDGPGSLTWFFEIALANFFFVAFREEFTRISLCLYSARSLHSLIPCLLTDQNFKNNSEKGHSRNISMRLFQNLTNSFREDFLWFCLCPYSQVTPIHQSLVHGQIKISLTFLREVTLGTFLWIGN